jgi:hypothetical protein
MNQRTLKVLWLTTGGERITTGATTHSTILDLSQDVVTTGAWTYANIGRREIKVFGSVQLSIGSTGAATFTGYNPSLYSSSVSTGASPTLLSGIITTATTWGGYEFGHVVSNQRYLYACPTSTANRRPARPSL